MYLEAQMGTERPAQRRGCLERVFGGLLEGLSIIFLLVVLIVAIYVEIVNVIFPLLNGLISRNPAAVTTVQITSYDVILWLLSAMFIFLLVEKWRDKQRIGEIVRGEVGAVIKPLVITIQEKSRPMIPAPIIGQDRLFQEAVKTLNDQNRQWEHIRIYAPVGLWDSTSEKTQWFKALASALESGKLGELRVLFGLPPKDRFLELNLENAKKALEIFKDPPHATIYCIPPAQGGVNAALGLGMVIFDEELLVLGFARNEQSTVIDTAVVIDQNDVVKRAREWFDSQVWRSFRNKQEYAIRDAYPRVPFEEGLENIDRLYVDPEICK